MNSIRSFFLIKMLSGIGLCTIALTGFSQMLSSDARSSPAPVSTSPIIDNDGFSKLERGVCGAQEEWYICSP